MKKYIFLTAEGYTYQPDSHCASPDVENLQVLGFGEGNTVNEALISMISDNPYLKEMNFNEAIGMELKDGQFNNVCLVDYKK